MINLPEFGRMLVLFGLLLAGFGLILLLVGNVPWIGNLPGDIYYEGDNYTVYFPLTTCLLLSVLISLVFYLINFPG